MYIITFANVNIVFLICLNLSKLLKQTFLFVYGPMCISGDQDMPCQSEFVQLINVVDTGFVSNWLPTRIHKNIEHFEYHSINQSHSILEERPQLQIKVLNLMATTVVCLHLHLQQGCALTKTQLYRNMASPVVDVMTVLRHMVHPTKLHRSSGGIMGNTFVFTLWLIE